MAITKVTTPVTGFESAVDIGLKIPVGTNSNLPTGLEGMIRNDTDENSGGSGSTTAITHYNGSIWRYFSSTISTTPSGNFNPVIWNGNSTTGTDIDCGFAPDLVWIKKRSGGVARNHRLFDTIRGEGERIFSDLANAQSSSSDEMTAFLDDGFTLGNSDATNGSTSSAAYVAWCFKAGGLTNKAADFNGSSSKITLSSSFTSALDVSTKTISTWVNADNVTPGFGMAFSMNATSLSYGRVIFQLQNSNKELTFLIGNSSPYITTTLVPNTWYHIAVSLNGSSFECFVNGTSVGTGTNNNYGDSSGDTTIGAYNVSGNPYNWTGKIGQVRFFNSALSASQVTELYNETAADNSVLNYPTGAGCIAAYPLGENANGLDGLYNGTASNVTFGKPGYLTRNNNGTIESTVSVNDTIGFSIVSYIGVGGSLKTIGHGLDAAPEMIIVKSTSNSDQWWVWHKDLTSIDYYLILSGINPETYYANNEGLFGRTLPTSTVFSVGYASETNGSGRQYISYCFTSKPGFSKVGNYTGNGGNNPVDIGFEPAFVMIKNTTSNASWAMFDNKRTTANPSTSALFANESVMEDDLQLYFEFTSTGFKNLQSSTTLNANGSKYIYLAFAK